MRIPRPTYTNVTATVALFVALGGSSYAAARIDGGDIRNGTLTGADLRDGSVTTRDVDNGTLAGSDVKNDTLTSSDVDDGSLEASDVKPGEGPAGAPGPAGPAGATQAAVRRSVEVHLDNGETAEATAACQPGEVAVGGGAGHDGLPSDLVAILADEPLQADDSPPAGGQPATKWRAIGQNVFIAGPPEVNMSVYVLCAKGS